MNDIENKLLAEKHKIQSLEAPENFDKYIDDTLNSIKKQHHQPVLMKIVMLAAAVLLLTLITYNHQAIADYGKKILGFDYLYGKIATLNKEEKGQAIEETIELEDGLFLTVNGVIADANQTILFYTYDAQDGIDNYDLSNYRLHYIEGTESFAKSSGGSSFMEKTETEEKGIAKFEPINSIEKKLKLKIWDSKKEEHKEVTFNYDPNKTMKASLNIQPNATIPLDKGSITIDSIKASPMMTLVKGTFKIGDYDEANEYIRDIMLYADDLYVGRLGKNLLKTEEGKDAAFEIEFDPLPENYDYLHVEVEEFIGFESLNETIEIDENNGAEFVFNDHKFNISAPRKIEDEIEFTIISDPTYQFSQLSLDDGTSAKLVDEYYPIAYESKERIYRFKTDTIPKNITVEGIYFPRTYHKKVDIPLE